MEDSIMERYVSFICEEIPGSMKVRISPPPPKDDGTLGYSIMPKIGPWVTRNVGIELIEKYTRSAKIRLSFDSYHDESIYYMSRRKGPETILDEIHNKIVKIVNSRFKEENRTEDIRDEYSKLSGIFEKMKIKNNKDQ